MAVSTIDYAGFARVRRRAGRWDNLDFSPLMVRWQELMVQDNRDALLAGIDKDGRPMVPTYRERNVESRWATIDGRRVKLLGSQEGGAGKPLAPRGVQSRAIAYFGPTRYGRSKGEWFAECGWLNFTSRDGRPILPFHAAGAGRLPRRDIIGVRPATKDRARQLLDDYLQELARL